MQKIIIRYIGNDIEMKTGTLALEKPWNVTQLYQIVDLNEIADAKVVEEKEVIEDTHCRVLFLFCIADGKPVAYMYKGRYFYDKVKGKYFLEI